MDRTLIEKLVTKHEGKTYSVYQDSLGNLTIGIGFNLDSSKAASICERFELSLNDLKNGTLLLSDLQVDSIFEFQLSNAISEAITILPNFNTMPDVVQAVAVDLIFNMGLSVFRKFHDTISSLERGDWKEAATNLKNSKWFHQVGNRGVENTALLEGA